MRTSCVPSGGGSGSDTIGFFPTCTPHGRRMAGIAVEFFEQGNCAGVPLRYGVPLMTVREGAPARGLINLLPHVRLLPRQVIDFL